MPDGRGRFARSLDDGAGIDTGRAIGTNQDFAIENITGTYGPTMVNNSTPAAGTGAFFRTDPGSIGSPAGASTERNTLNFDASLVVNTSTETRPINIAYLEIIKY